MSTARLTQQCPYFSLFSFLLLISGQCTIICVFPRRRVPHTPPAPLTQTNVQQPQAYCCVKPYRQHFWMPPSCYITLSYMARCNTHHQYGSRIPHKEQTLYTWCQVWSCWVICMYTVFQFSLCLQRASWAYAWMHQMRMLRLKQLMALSVCSQISLR